MMRRAQAFRKSPINGTVGIIVEIRMIALRFGSGQRSGIEIERHRGGRSTSQRMHNQAHGI
jgi:hypothetical protein